MKLPAFLIPPKPVYHGVMGIFYYVDDATGAVNALRGSGHRNLSIFSPVPHHDLEKAILSRIQHKMGKRLEVMAACPSCGAVLQCNHHDSLGRCHCTGEFGPCCQCS